MIGQHRVAQQRRFLLERKKLQLQQFRTTQKLELIQRRQKIRQQRQLMARITRQRYAGKVRKARKTLSAFGIRW